MRLIEFIGRFNYNDFAEAMKDDHDTRMAEVYNEILPEFERYHIEDTLKHRYLFLLGMLDEWAQHGTDNSTEKLKVMFAIELELEKLRRRISVWENNTIAYEREVTAKPIQKTEIPEHLRNIVRFD